MKSTLFSSIVLLICSCNELAKPTTPERAPVYSNYKIACYFKCIEKPDTLTYNSSQKVLILYNDGVLHKVEGMRREILATNVSYFKYLP